MYQTQEAIDLWSGLIHATGGALVPSKTFRDVIEFTWQIEWAYATIDDVLGSLKITDTTRTTHDIE